MKKNILKSQQKGGRKRAQKAQRNAKGQFSGNSSGSEALHPGCHADGGQLGQEAYEPAHIVVDVADVADAGYGKLKRWERHIETAMEDMVWLEVIAMQTKLPVFKRKTEIVAYFKRHVIAQGKEDEILSAKEAKSYFANCTRIGSPMYKRLLEELERSTHKANQTATKKNAYRYEDRDPRTGERSYYGITIPPEMPPRPNEEAVLVNGLWQ